MEDKVLLDVQGLKTYFHTFKGVVKAVDNVSFSLKEGEILGIVGESGSGKSVTSFSILKLVEIQVWLMQTISCLMEKTWQRSVKKICQRSVEKTFPWYSRIL